MAGFRVSECLAWSKFLYVDDLVSGIDDRSKGYGGILFDWLVAYAREAGCDEFHLDSGVQRFAASPFLLEKTHGHRGSSFWLEVKNLIDYQMTVAESKALVRRFYEELWNKRRIEIADEIVAPDCVTYQLQSGSEDVGAPRNAEAIKHHVAAWLAGFADYILKSRKYLRKRTEL